MQLSYVLICVLIMALVTYLPRMLPLAIFKRKIENPFIRSFLAYVPYAVLAAMTLPDILYSTSTMVSAVCGLGAALVLSYFNRGLLTVALGATATVFVVELILRFIP